MARDTHARNIIHTGGIIPDESFIVKQKEFSAMSPRELVKISELNLDDIESLKKALNAVLYGKALLADTHVFVKLEIKKQRERIEWLRGYILIDNNGLEIPLISAKIPVTNPFFQPSGFRTLNTQEIESFYSQLTELEEHIKNKIKRKEIEDKRNNNDSDEHGKNIRKNIFSSFINGFKEWWEK